MTEAVASAASDQTIAITTSDGVPLKQSLQRALRLERRRALLLVLPLFAFIFFTFLLPIGDMLFRSVDNSVMGNVMPKTTTAIKDWDPNSGELPSEAVYAALVSDFTTAGKSRTIGRAARRLNYERPGVSSLFRKSARKIKKVTAAPYKDAVIKTVDKRWGDVNLWRLIRRESDRFTLSYGLAAVDMRFDDTGNVVAQPEFRQIYVSLFWRTLAMSLGITGVCLLLGFPIAYLLATLGLRTSNLLMILVLLPFWTSLLVRTTTWIVLLQKHGVLNDFGVWLGIVDDANRVQMIHNATGTVIAMTHILLPFMVLPLYSVMKTIPPSYMRAARSLGANQFTAFTRVYIPQTLPGVGAGSILVFILSIGFYITPALVGGRTGTFISNYIASHVSETLNWGLAAALGGILLSVVLALFLLYNRLVGIDNMKLG